MVPTYFFLCLATTELYSHRGTWEHRLLMEAVSASTSRPVETPVQPKLGRLTWSEASGAVGDLGTLIPLCAHTV